MRVLIAVILLMGCCGCDVVVLSPVGLADTASDVDGEPLRIPMVLPDDVDSDVLMVPGTGNSESIQGFWYAFSHDDKSLEVYALSGDTVCVRGDLTPSSEGTYAWAGLGFSLCFTDGETDPPWSILPLSSCPYGDDLIGRLLGASFVVRGTVPSRPLRLHFKEQGDQNPPGLDIVLFGERADYLIADAQDPPGTSFDIDTLAALQLHLDVSPDMSESVDFCMSGLEILLRQ